MGFVPQVDLACCQLPCRPAAEPERLRPHRELSVIQERSADGVTEEKLVERLRLPNGDDGACTEDGAESC